MTAIPTEEDTEEASRLFPEEVPNHSNSGDAQSAFNPGDIQSTSNQRDAHSTFNTKDPHNTSIGVDDGDTVKPQSPLLPASKEASATHEINTEKTCTDHAMSSPEKNIPVEEKKTYTPEVELSGDPTPSQAIPLTDDDLLQLLEMEDMPPPPTPTQTKSRTDTEMSEVEAIFSTQSFTQGTSVHVEEEASLQNSLKEERFFFTQNATAPSRSNDVSLLSLDDMSDIIGDDMKSFLWDCFLNSNRIVLYTPHV